MDLMKENFEPLKNLNELNIKNNYDDFIILPYDTQNKIIILAIKNKNIKFLNKIFDIIKKTIKLNKLFNFKYLKIQNILNKLVKLHIYNKNIYDYIFLNLNHNVNFTMFYKNLLINGHKNTSILDYIFLNNIIPHSVLYNPIIYKNIKYYNNVTRTLSYIFSKNYLNINKKFIKLDNSDIFTLSLFNDYNNMDNYLKNNNNCIYISLYYWLILYQYKIEFLKEIPYNNELFDNKTIVYHFFNITSDIKNYKHNLIISFLNILIDKNIKISKLELMCYLNNNHNKNRQTIIETLNILKLNYYDTNQLFCDILNNSDDLISKNNTICSYDKIINILNILNSILEPSIENFIKCFDIFKNRKVKNINNIAGLVNSLNYYKIEKLLIDNVLKFENISYDNYIKLIEHILNFYFESNEEGIAKLFYFTITLSHYDKINDRVFKNYYSEKYPSVDKLTLFEIIYLLDIKFYNYNVYYGSVAANLEFELLNFCMETCNCNINGNISIFNHTPPMFLISKLKHLNNNNNDTSNNDTNNDNADLLEKLLLLYLKYGYNKNIKNVNNDDLFSYYCSNLSINSKLILQLKNNDNINSKIFIKNQCNICLLSYQENKNIRQIIIKTCGHSCCSDCIKYVNKCPLCRANFNNLDCSEIVQDDYLYDNNDSSLENISSNNLESVNDVNIND